MTVQINIESIDNIIKRFTIKEKQYLTRAIERTRSAEKDMIGNKNLQKINNKNIKYVNHKINHIKENVDEYRKNIETYLTIKTEEEKNDKD